MKKRTFLKLSSALAAGAALSPLVSCMPDKSKQIEPLKNWASNLTYATANVFEPNSVEEVQEIVGRCKKLRALGTRHCFNRIADSEHNLISTQNLNQVMAIDTASNSGAPVNSASILLTRPASTLPGPHSTMFVRPRALML